MATRTPSDAYLTGRVSGASAVVHAVHPARPVTTRTGHRPTARCGLTIAMVHDRAFDPLGESACPECVARLHQDGAARDGLCPPLFP